MKKVLLILSLCIPAFAFTQTWADLNSTITNDLDDVFFTDNNNGWAVGRQGKIVRTTNGGTTWLEQNSGTTKDLNKIFMVSTGAGYAVGDGGTVIKYNGTSWSALNISFSQDMYGVFFLDASTGWVSGDWGCIKMTNDAGATWTTQMSNSIYSNTFNDLHMLSETEGWAVGSSGRVLKYNGTNWTNVSSPATANLDDLHGVSFTDSDEGFMCGESSGMYHWDGNSWSTYNTALPNNSYHVYDVHMVSATLGYAAASPGFGGQGMVLKYNGNTWVKDYEYPGSGTELFTGITSTPNGNIYAVANTGIIKTKSSGGTATGLIKNNNAINLSVYPNPFVSTFVFDFPVKEKGEVSLTIKDVTGKILKSASEKQLLHGNYSIAIDGSNLPSGIYFYTLTSSNFSQTGKIIKN
ncbi:hypothetical protein CNR22_21430 [Sphingobacteriaceae bacterium]|nr:hypothetical protein CNR22_21430 [Sphingobacteriaceae bacterium]